MNQSLQYRVLREQLNKNENPEGFKISIKSLLNDIEDRTYWYFTYQETQYLDKIYLKQVPEHQLRKRLNQITHEAMDSVFTEIMDGTLTKVTVQHDELIASIKILEKVESITAEGQNYYSPSHPVAKDNVEKIKMINEDLKLFKSRVEQMKQKQRQKKLQRQEMERQIQQKILEQKKLQYHKEVMHRLQMMRLKQEQRIEQNQKFKQFLKDFKKSKPLHVLMEQEFREKVQLPQLEQNRKKLELYKYKKKPTLQQINDHERAFMTLKESRPTKVYIKNQTIDVPYKSEFYKKIQEQEKTGYEDEYTSTVWDQMEKKKRYSLMVKENFKPKTSRPKNLSIDDSRQRKSEKKIVPDSSRAKEIGKFYLEYVKSLQKNRSNTATVSGSEQIQQQGGQSRSRYKNYLQELRSSEGKHKALGSDWRVDLNDRTASRTEKRERVLIKSKQLQEKAMRDQMLINNFNHGKAEQIIGKKKQIDETLLSAIKAKMALLKQAKEQQ